MRARDRPIRGPAGPVMGRSSPNRATRICPGQREVLRGRTASFTAAALTANSSRGALRRWQLAGIRQQRLRRRTPRGPETADRSREGRPRSPASRTRLRRGPRRGRPARCRSAGCRGRPLPGPWRSAARRAGRQGRRRCAAPRPRARDSSRRDGSASPRPCTGTRASIRWPGCVSTPNGENAPVSGPACGRCD